MISHRLGVVVALGFSLLLAGCQDPRHEARIDHREDNLHRTLALLARSEEGRDVKLERMLQLLRQRHAEDIIENQRNAQRIEEAVQREFEDWRKVQPVHERNIRKHFAGDLDNIERTLPYVLY